MGETVIRRGTAADAKAIFDMIYGLAVYEKMEDQVTGSVESLASDIENGYAHTFVLDVDGKTVGFALYFFNYSTFKTKRGIHLEDLYVLPEYRGRGFGKQLFLRMKEEAAALGCGRLEWCCLYWNAPSIAFYEHMEASCVDEWRIWRFDETDFAPDPKKGV